MDIDDFGSPPATKTDRYRPLGGEDFPDEWPLEGRELTSQALRDYRALAVGAALAVAAAISWGWLHSGPTTGPIAQSGPDPIVTGTIPSR